MSGTVRVERPDGLRRPSKHHTPEMLTEVLHVRLTANDVERLNAIAASRRVEVSELVRSAIRFALMWGER